MSAFRTVQRSSGLAKRVIGARTYASAEPVSSIRTLSGVAVLKIIDNEILTLTDLEGPFGRYLARESRGS